MLLTNIEFFAHESDVWCRQGDGPLQLLKESDREFIDSLVSHIATFYPQAYDALCKRYERCALNKQYYLFRIATRFIKCNFSKLDNVPDISEKNNKCNFEYVECPLRGECEYENIICRPTFDSKLSTAELRVLRYWVQGLTKEEVAKELYLSPHTVHSHINNAYRRLNFLGINIRDKADFVRYAEQNNLFS